MTKWERMANRLEYFKGKDITELSTEEINEFLEIREECERIGVALAQFAQSMQKLASEFISNLTKGLK